MTQKATECAKLSIYARLLAAQKEFPQIEQNLEAKTNKFRYSYTDIHSVLNVIRPILNSHGLFLSQPLCTEENKVGVKTVIFSEDGETMESPMFFLEAYGNPQEKGSAATYARRYSLVSFLGIAVGEDHDDDANGSKDAYDQLRSAKIERKNKPAPAPAINYAELEQKAKFASLDGLEAYKKFFEALTGAEKTYLRDSGAHETLKKEAMNG